MLYETYELQHAAIAPIRMIADQGQRLLRHPLNPLSYTPGGRALAAAFDQFEHTTRRYGKPKFGLHGTVIACREVAVTERIVMRMPFCQIKHFERSTDRADPRVLVVAPLSGHYATLLRDTVATLLPDHDVFVTDWRDARRVPLIEGGFDLDDYIDTLIAFLRRLGPDTHVIAVCQPCVPVLAAVSLMAAEGDACVPASMVLMGGPIDARYNPSPVVRRVRTRPLSWFERTVIARVPPPHPGVLRRVFPGVLQIAGFMSMNLDRHIDAHWQIFRHLVEGDGDSAAQKRAFYEEFLAVMDLPAEYYLQSVRTVFQEFALPDGRMVSRGRKVEPAAIARTALMTIEGERDDIAGIGQTRAAHDLCLGLSAGMRAHYQQPGVGHYGLFHGRKWHDQVAPRIRRFIRAHHRAAP